MLFPIAAQQVVLRRGADGAMEEGESAVGCVLVAM